MAGTLAEMLISQLVARFPNRGLRIHEGKEPVASFPAAHPKVGDLRIDDDGGELTISIGQLTHGHFTSQDNAPQSQEKEEDLIERVMEFLDKVFNDQIEFWSAGKAGGWHARGEKPIGTWPKRRRFVWSGPLSPQHEGR
jgi:hypothetical protein